MDGPHCPPPCIDNEPYFKELKLYVVKLAFHSLQDLRFSDVN